MKPDLPITIEELQVEFEKISEIFSNGSAEQRFEATATMLRLFSRYFSSNIQDFDIFPLTSVLSDLAAIEIGRSAIFIKTHQKVEGKNPDPRIHMYNACISAAVIILSRNGYSKITEAERYVGKIASLKQNQVHQIRSDFGSRGTTKEIESYYIEQINLKFSTIEDAENHAKALIKPILQLLNK